MSQRFNADNDDIRYQRRDTDIPVDPTHPDVDFAMSINNTDNMLDLVADGKKTVETRENKSAFNMFKGKTVGLLDRATNKIVAYAEISDKLKEYNTYEDFRKDFKNHRVPAKSTFDMKKGKDGKWIKKYGIVFDKVEKLDTPIDAKGRNFALGKTMYYTPSDSEVDVKYQDKLSPLEQEFVDKQKKTTYNEFETLFMQWAYGSTEPGTLKAMYRPYGKKWVIYEKTDDGVVELFSGNSYVKVRDLYEQAYGRSIDEILRNYESIESSKGDNDWDNALLENGRYADTNSRNISRKGLQSDSGRSGADLFEGNSGELNLTNDERSTDNDGAFFDAKKQSKDSTDVDLDVIRSLTEANKQLTTELGKAKVTNEKLIERAKNLADKYKEKPCKSTLIVEMPGFSCLVNLVEMAVIETASEKSPQGLSTSVSYLLTFPLSGAGNRAHEFSRRIMHDRNTAVTCSRSLLIDASYAAAVLRTETAA